MSPSSQIIEIRDVTKRFGGAVAVANVNLSIQRGEFVTLLGPSGCGKTTLLRMLSGFEIPSEGSIHISGEDVTSLPPYRRNVNQVFQSYALFPHLTVEQNIAFGLRMQKVAKAEAARRVSEVIELVALGGMESRRPTELSGGQRQRVALARAIVPKPEVLLLDEPLSALDAKLRRTMQLELKRLQRHLGLTMVFVTHDQEEALTLSDRVAVMTEGRIEQVGTAVDVYERPATRFVADFLGEANLIPVTLRRLANDHVVGRTKEGWELAVGPSDAALPSGTAVLSIRPEKVHVSKNPIQGENVAQATVVEQTFQGASNRLSLRLKTGAPLTAIVANASAHRGTFHQIDSVFVALHRDDLIVIPTS